MPGRMAGRVALVTGGGGGIGEATGRLFAEEGAAVALVDSDKAAVEAAAAGIVKAVAGARVSALAADLTSEPESQRVVDATLAAFGALHTLVNVAGVRLYTPLAEADAKGWEFIFGVNVLATAYCCKVALPALRQGGRGTIVNLSSVYGVKGRAGMDGYLDSNFEKAKALLKEGGYDGTPIVLMVALDLSWFGGASSTLSDLTTPSSTIIE